MILRDLVWHYECERIYHMYRDKCRFWIDLGGDSVLFPDYTTL